MSTKDILRPHATLPDVNMRDRQRSPDIFKRQRDNQRLVIIGVNHIPDPTAPHFAILRPTLHEWVEQTQGQPRIIFNEGYNRPQRETEEASILAASESGFLRFWAKKYRIAIRTSEPPNLSESESLLEQGFTRDEIMYYYIARQIPQWHRNISPDLPDFRTYMDQTIERYRDMRNWGYFDFSYDRMLEVHKQLLPDHPFNPDDPEFFLEQTVKYHKSNTRVQQIAQACNQARDLYKANNILRYWQKGYSIFEIGGWPHALVLEPLTEELGVPQTVNDQLGNAVTIERARVDDIDEIVALHAKVCIKTYTGVTPELTEEAVRFHAESQDFRERKANMRRKTLLDPTQGIVYVARSGNKIVGYGALDVDDEGEWQGRGLYVSRQGGGIGTALLNRMMKWHDPDKDIILNVVPGTPAVDFFKSFGFKPTTTVWESPLAGGQRLPQQEIVFTAQARRSTKLKKT